MATKPDEVLLRELYSHKFIDRDVAERAGCSVDQVKRWRKREGLAPNGGNGVRNLQSGATAKPFEVEPLPDEKLSAEELLARRKSQFSRKAIAKKARKLINVAVRINGPIGIAHFGDPHVDDDGTDIGMLEHHASVVNRTEGMFAGNVGDFTNNWVGRLARLYGEQSTSAAEAWVLAEWLIKSCDWLYLVGGNHDAWSGAGDPLNWISKQQGSLLEPHGARLCLTMPNGRSVRVNARHDFKGHSMWNDAHGPAKAAQLGWRDHVLACGHLHTAAHQYLRDPSSGLITHAFRVASYKVYDKYAEAGGLPDKNIFVCPVTIIDPKYPEDDNRFITFIPDPEEGADFLTFKRQKKSA